MRLPFRKPKYFVENGTRYVVRPIDKDLPTEAIFTTREEARDFKRAAARAHHQPQLEIVVHEFIDGYELPERVTT